MSNGLMEILAEAKRRRVFRTAGVYLVAVWGISQGAVELAPLFGAPEWALRWTVIAAVACLPLVVVLAWMFDIGRSGIVRDPQDVKAQQEADAALASMPTMLGGELGTGAIVVRWDDSQGQNASLFVDEFFVGRGSDCRVRFYDPLVSRRHARVYHDADRWMIEDLGSRNGTIVDEKKIEASPLTGEHEVRVNEAGPALCLEVLPSGPATLDAVASFASNPSVAHVRSPSLDLDRTRGAGTAKK